LGGNAGGDFGASDFAGDNVGATHFETEVHVVPAVADAEARRIQAESSVRHPSGASNSGSESVADSYETAPLSRQPSPDHAAGRGKLSRLGAGMGGGGGGIESGIGGEGRMESGMGGSMVSGIESGMESGMGGGGGVGSSHLERRAEMAGREPYEGLDRDASPDLSPRSPYGHEAYGGMRPPAAGVDVREDASAVHVMDRNGGGVLGGVVGGAFVGGSLGEEAVAMAEEAVAMAEAEAEAAAERQVQASRARV